jgi:hypothetical protein
LEASGTSLTGASVVIWKYTFWEQSQGRISQRKKKRLWPNRERGKTTRDTEYPSSRRFHFRSTWRKLQVSQFHFTSSDFTCQKLTKSPCCSIKCRKELFPKQDESHIYTFKNSLSCLICRQNIGRTWWWCQQLEMSLINAYFSNA